MEETQKTTPHVIFLPTPGMGHVIPLTQFAKKLVHHYNFSVTFTIPTDGPPSTAMKSVLQNLPQTINHIFLPPVNLDDLPTDVKAETRICLTVSRSLPSLREAFQTITASHRVVALVVDLFGTDGFDVAKEFKVPSYVFFLPPAMCLSLFLHLPYLDQKYDCEYRDVPELIELPGCVPIHGSYFLDPTQDRKNEAYKWVLHHCKRYKLADGILVNSFVDLEPGVIGSLKILESGKPPIYPVGPIIQKDSATTQSDGSGSLKWLDNQPRGSVLFVSFGSGGTLSNDQLNELALGLEMSEQRFLWVLRSPSDKATNEAFFSAQSTKDPLDFLPKGFLERTKGLGLVVPSWAPQIQVLSHGSTGGFLTHCGWNSALESIVHGVPLIAWPLYAEQKMNSVLLVEDLKVALKPKANDNGLIGREEITRVVRGLMEGDEGKSLRNKMMDLKDSAAVVLSEDGSSTKSFMEVANKWKNHQSI